MRPALCACRLGKNVPDLMQAWSVALGRRAVPFLRSGPPALPEVAGVLFKTTSQKEFHPRPAVVLFSRACSTRTPRRMYRCEQERVCQTLENKTTYSERHRCRLEKSGRDRRASHFKELRLFNAFLAASNIIFVGASRPVHNLNCSAP
jgi:hypothetical protein